MSTTITLTTGGKPYTVKPRTLNLERALSTDGGIRDRMRQVQGDRTRLNLELAIVQQQTAELAIGETLDEATVDGLIERAHDLERRLVANAEAQVGIELEAAALMLADADGQAPTPEELADADLTVIGIVMGVLAGVDPTNRTQTEG